MCLRCESGSDQVLARHTHALQLLALIEQPDALPADAALRLAREILALVEDERPGRRCDPVFPPAPTIRQSG